MQIIKKNIKQMNRAIYNPRAELTPQEKEYQDLKQSISKYGMIIPIVWNKRTNNIISGHQRLTILENQGETEVEVSVVDLDETKEKQLNIALNKITGIWEEEKLSALLKELGKEAVFTGFTQLEMDNIMNDIENLIDDDIVKKELESVQKTFNITLTFEKTDETYLKEYIKQYGKKAIVQMIIQKGKENDSHEL